LEQGVREHLRLDDDCVMTDVAACALRSPEGVLKSPHLRRTAKAHQQTHPVLLFEAFRWCPKASFGMLAAYPCCLVTRALEGRKGRSAVTWQCWYLPERTETGLVRASGTECCWQASLEAGRARRKWDAQG